MEHIVEDLKEIARQAGNVILKYYRCDGYEISVKRDQSLVTQADKDSNELICKSLALKYGNIPLLSEESKDNYKLRLENDYCFIIDPLDGTREFVSGRPGFAVNIAMVYKQRPLATVVYIPYFDKMYYAYKGKGSFLDHRANKGKRLKTSAKTKNLIMVMTSPDIDQEDKNIIAANKDVLDKPLYIGGAIKPCLIAEGVADIYYRFGDINEWDIAAPELILTEAGGVLKYLDDKDITYNATKGTLLKKPFYCLNNENNKLHLGVKF